MKHTYVLLSLVAAATLTACSSGGSTASLGNSGALISHTGHQTDHAGYQTAGNLPSLPSYQLSDQEMLQKQNATLLVDGKKSSANLNLSQLSVGLYDKQLDVKVANNIVFSEKLRIYRQPNSVVVGNKRSNYQHFRFDDVGGNATKTLPTAGIYQYKGHAFTGDSQGDFNYNINFTTKTGQGSFNLNGKTTTLPEGTIQKRSHLGHGHGLPDFNGYAINSKNNELYYQLGIFGNQAEEVAGYASLLQPGPNNHQVVKNQIGLVGTKQ